MHPHLVALAAKSQKISHFTGIELDEEYLEVAADFIRQANIH